MRPATAAVLGTIIRLIDPGVIDEGEGPLDVAIIVVRTGAAAGVAFGCCR